MKLAPAPSRGSCQITVPWLGLPGNVRTDVLSSGGTGRNASGSTSVNDEGQGRRAPSASAHSTAKSPEIVGPSVTAVSTIATRIPPSSAACASAATSTISSMPSE